MADQACLTIQLHGTGTEMIIQTETLLVIGNGIGATDFPVQHTNTAEPGLSVDDVERFPSRGIGANFQPRQIADFGSMGVCAGLAEADFALAQACAVIDVYLGIVRAALAYQLVDLAQLVA
ncbi:hypothetical protein D3C81_1629930 [compost metagenome]